MAYILVEISGNKDFGGYLSVDGSDSIALQDGFVYELDPGLHVFELHSTSDAERRNGNFQRNVRNMNILAGNSRMAMISDMQANASTGDTWEFEADVDEGDCLHLKVCTKKNKVIAAPVYAVRELTDEARAEYDQMFEEMRAEQERIANTPRVSKKMIVWGAILAGVFLIMLIDTISNGSSEAGRYIGSVVGTVVGALLIFFGSKKKVRK